MHEALKRQPHFQSCASLKNFKSNEIWPAYSLSESYGYVRLSNWELLDSTDYDWLVKPKIEITDHFEVFHTNHPSPHNIPMKPTFSSHKILEATILGLKAYQMSTLICMKGLNHPSLDLKQQMKEKEREVRVAMKRRNSWKKKHKVRIRVKKMNGDLRGFGWCLPIF